jgi:hypothetical protein
MLVCGVCVVCVCVWFVVCGVLCVVLSPRGRKPQGNGEGNSRSNTGGPHYVLAINCLGGRTPNP